MRALVQRVSQASVEIDGQVIGSIGKGLAILLGISRLDGEEDADYIVGKAVNLRIFPDEEDRFKSSALEIGAELLIVSQFTLYANTRKGRRPSFVEAAPPEQAESLFAETVKRFEETSLNVETGRFQAHMQVSIRNDGPVTILLDSTDRERPRRG